MSDNVPHNVLYELQEKSLQAAKDLEKELREELKNVPVQSTGKMGDIKKSWDAMYDGLLARLEQDNPLLLKQTGLKDPATMVYKGAQSLPRAYEEYPEIFTSPEENPRYFMFAPVDYKGNHFVPEDGRKITGKESAQIGDLLFAGGWLGNAPIISTEKKGVATPSDYVAPSASKLKQAFSHSPNDRVVFLAKGTSLASIEDYKARKEDWKNKLDKANDQIKLHAEKMRETILSGLPEGEDIRFNSSYRYQMNGGGKAELLLSASIEGKTNLMLGGQRVQLLESPAFTLVETQPLEYQVLPRTDTPEGREIAKYIDAIPDTPGLSDYPDLISDFELEQNEIADIFGGYDNIPQLVELEGYSFLIYNVSPEDTQNTFSPPDAAKVPTEIYQWLQSDQSDKNMGVTPPPMPDTVKQFLDNTPRTSAPAQTRRRQP